MSKSSPETYRGLLEYARKTYRDAMKSVQATNSSGFRRLVRWDEIDLAVEKLSETKGMLRIKIKELDESSKAKKKYEIELNKIVKLLGELREKQRTRNKVKLMQI